MRSIQRDSGIEMYVGGLMGCKGDAYTGEGALSERDAYDFHSWQAECFGKADADFLYAGIMPVLSEAAGMAEAIQYIDQVTKTPPACYMTNCVHPGIVYQALSQTFN